jgi:hypothetical protein
MSNAPRPKTYKGIRGLINRFRDDLDNQDNDFILLYAYNGTGKTRLSMAFKDHGKRGGGRDTLYFNAFTEDLFHWDNDLTNDSQRLLKLNPESQFFAGFKELALEEKIFSHLEKYADFDFRIDYDNLTVNFSRDVTIKERGVDRVVTQDHIKVSRGEENLFIWCTFLTIFELAIEGQEAYDWVKYIYIDDPISSLDDNNALAVATDLSKMLYKGKDKLKVMISTHHGLFFNIMCNELKKHTGKKSYFLYRNRQTDHYQLQSTGDTPFFYHVAMLKELKEAADADPPRVYTYHFNVLRSIMEQTAAYFGAADISFCLPHDENEALRARALNIFSHRNYSVHAPRLMQVDNQILFSQILSAFLQKFPFQLPELEPVAASVAAAIPSPSLAPQDTPQ